MSSPIGFQWDGEALYPVNKSMAKRCDDEFVIGQRYTMEEVKERSSNSHRHYFAAIREAWLNMPEQYGLEPWAQSPEHLRKYALIRCGYHDSNTYVASSKAEAQKMALFIRPIDDYAIVTAKEKIVTRYTAKSQMLKAMDRKNFQDSKQAVLDFLNELLGLEGGAIEEQAA